MKASHCSRNGVLFLLLLLLSGFNKVMGYCEGVSTLGTLSSQDGNAKEDFD